MKRILFISAILSAALMAAGCSDAYEFGYDSMYYTGPDGEDGCYIPREYNLGSESGRLPVYITYAGAWEVSIAQDTDWAFIDRNCGRGPGYVRLFYTTNKGQQRTLTINVAADNGEIVGITVNQKEK